MSVRKNDGLLLLLLFFLKTRFCVLKTRNCVLKTRVLYIKNEELCIKKGVIVYFLKNDEFYRRGGLSHAAKRSVFNGRILISC